MPTLEELKKSGAIGAQYVEAKKRFKANFNKRKASAGNIEVFLSQKMQDHDFGQIGLSTKQDLQMLEGMLKLFKRSGITDKEVYGFISDLVEHWDDLRRMPTNSLKGKSWILNSRPSIKDICICRESLSANLEAIKSSKESISLIIESHVDSPQAKVSESEIIEVDSPSTNKFRPTQNEIDAEYARMVAEDD